MRTRTRLRRTGRFLIPLLTCLLLGSPALASDKLKVVTTLPDLGWMVREIGGDRVEVESLCLGYQDPHYLEAKPSYARDLRSADLLVYVGLELEAAWLPRLLEASRNPDLRPGSAHLYEAASSVSDILEVPTGSVDRSQGDIHPFGNPHLLLDPRRMIEISHGVADALAGLDPAHRSDYETARKKLEADLTGRMAGWEERAAPLREHPVVCFHKQWEYLADWLGLDILDYIENRPGVPPSPRHVSDLIEQMKEHGVRVVMAATFVDVHAAEEVARRAGAQLAVLPASVGGVDGTDTYPELLDRIMDTLVSANAGEGE